MHNYSDVGHLVEDNRDAFEASPTWNTFVATIGKPHLEVYDWAARSYDSLKRNPRLRSGTPLLAPDARSFADLFEAVEFLPTKTKGHDRRGKPVEITASYPGLFIVGCSQDHGRKTRVAPYRHVGGSRSVVEGSDGSAWRRTSGGAYHACYARPGPGLSPWAKMRTTNFKDHLSFAMNDRDQGGNREDPSNARPPHHPQQHLEGRDHLTGPWRQLRCPVAPGGRDAR